MTTAVQDGFSWVPLFFLLSPVSAAPPLCLNVDVSAVLGSGLVDTVYL